MKNYLFALLLIIFLPGCEDDVDPARSLAYDLQTIINEESVTALTTCCAGCQCDNEGSQDFSFPGDNVVRITSSYFNLEQMQWFSIRETETGVLMVLYMPRD